MGLEHYDAVIDRCKRKIEALQDKIEFYKKEKERQMFLRKQKVHKNG